MKRTLLVAVVLALLWLLPLSASAGDIEEIVEKSGAEELAQSLDEDTQELLSQLGVEDGQWQENQGEGLLQGVSHLMREKLTAPLKGLAALVGVVVLCRLAGSFEEDNGVSALVGTVACAGTLIAPLLDLIRETGKVIDSACAFIGASVPVYSALFMASGNTVVGGSYSFLTLAAGSAIPVLANGLLLPLLHGFLLLALTSALCQGRLDGLLSAVYGFAKWALVFAVTLFSGILSVQTVLNAQVDAAAGKTAKLLASSAIPLVGGAFGDAVAALQSSVQIVKSGVGAFGILAALCVFGPLALEAALWMGVCQLSQVAAGLFDAPRLGKLFQSCGAVTKMILAVLASVCAVAVVSAALVIFVKGTL